MASGTIVRKVSFREDLNLSWRVPASQAADSRTRMQRKRQNRYLEFMERKLITLIERDPKEAGAHYERFSRRSRLFAVYVLMRANKGFSHKGTGEECKGYITEYLTIMRLKKYRLKVSRFYIPKASGKLRPVGSPSPASKMVYLANTLFLEKGLEKRIGPYQHGFRKGRSTATAGMEVINNILTGKKVYEFDLSGFFNNIHAELVGRKLRNEIWDLGNGLRYCTRGTFPDFDRGDPSDREVWKDKKMEDGTEKGLRSGFTQGASGSPIICSYVLELAGYNNIDGLVMYADDGLIFRDDESDVPTLDSRKWGIEVAAEKRNGGVKDEFTFLGVTYNLLTETVHLDGKLRSMHAPKDDLMEFLSYGTYGQNERKGGRSCGYGNEWAGKAKDNSITVTDATPGNRGVVADTGVCQTDERTFSTTLVDKLLSMICGLSVWEKPQGKKVHPTKEVKTESEKLFGMNIRIGNKVVQESLHKRT